MAARKPRVIIDSVKLQKAVKLSVNDLTVAIKLRDTQYLKSPNTSRIGRMAAARRDKAAKLMAGYYSGTLRSLQSVFDNPGTGVWLAPVERRFYRRIPITVGYHGSKMPQTEEVRLESGVTSFSKWEGLSPNYANSQGKWSGLPPSRNIWRKTGELRDAYNAWFASQSSKLGNPESYHSSRIDFKPENIASLGVVTGPGKGYRPFILGGKQVGYVPSSKRTLVGTFTFSLKHPSLGHPVLDRIIGKAYKSSAASGFDVKKNRGALLSTKRIPVTYTKGKLAGKTFTRNQPVTTQGLSRMGLAEERRPMISRFSAAAGAREAAALRKLLQRK